MKYRVAVIILGLSILFLTGSNADETFETLGVKKSQLVSGTDKRIGELTFQSIQTFSGFTINR